MADNIALHNDDTTLVGTLASDDIGGVQFARSKITLGADGVNDGDVSSANPMPVSGTVAANAGTGTFTVDQANAAEADYDSGAGTVNQVMFGLALPGAGGPVAGGTSTNPLRTDPTGSTTQPVSGTVSIGAAIPAGDNNIGNVDVVTMPTVTVTATDLDVRDLTSVSDSVAAVQSGAWSVSIGVALPAGTNNIGDVDVLTQPARAATTDTITAKLATDAIQNGITALTPKFASIDVATLGDNTIVAVVPGKKIRVLEYSLVCAAATTVTWKSATAGAISGDMSFAANGGIATPFSPLGQFETTAGEALVLNLSAANAVSGHLVYVEV